MPRSSIRLSAVLSLCLLGAYAGAQPADLVFTGGEIHTPQGWVAAVAIRDGVIIATGSAADIEPLRADTTEVIELNGAAVLPGLHDLHVHPLGAGLMQQQCLFPQGSSREQLLGAVRA